MSASSPDITLSSPLELAPGLVLRNRVVMGSLTRNRAGGYFEGVNDGTQGDALPSAINAEHYRLRARGGFGLIVSEGALVEPQGTEWIHAPGIWTEEQTLAWKEIVDAVHGEGGHIFCQLWHLGRVSHPDQMQQKVFGEPVRAPSEVGCRGGKMRELPGKPGFVPAPAMDDPKVVVEAFRQGAINAKTAGFDGVEFHCANGYLPAQFLDNYANRRTDSYGGSYQNRARFAIECLEAILSVWPADRVGIKLSPTGGYKDVGMDEKDTSETYGYLLSEISRLSLSYIQMLRHFDFGDPLYDHKKDGPGPEKEGERRALCPKLDLEEKLVKPFRESQKGRERLTKVFWVGGFGGREVGAEREATEWVESGRADGIVFARDTITNPDLPFRLFNNVPLSNIDGGDPKRWYSDGVRGKGDAYIELLSEEFLQAHGEGNVLVRVGA